MFGASKPFVQVYRGHHVEERFHEIVLNLDPCFRKRCGSFVESSGTIRAS